MSDKDIRQILKDERIFTRAKELASVLHGGDVSAWIADLVLSMADRDAFEFRCEELTRK